MVLLLSIADSASAITTGFEKVFGTEYIRVNCWFHLNQNIKDKLKKIPLQMAQEIKKDINVLQLSTSSKVFKVAVSCFLLKWKQYDEASEFIRFFENEHIEQRCNWYEGVAIGYPSTNNALEATNKSIKDYFGREKLPLSGFIKMTEKIIHNWSAERKSTKVSLRLIIYLFEL